METRLREVRLGALPDIKNLQRHYRLWLFQQVSPPETGMLVRKTFTLHSQHGKTSLTHLLLRQGENRSPSSLPMSQLRAAALHRVMTISCLLPFNSFNTKINLAMEMSGYLNISIVVCGVQLHLICTLWLRLRLNKTRRLLKWLLSGQAGHWLLAATHRLLVVVRKLPRAESDWRVPWPCPM